MTTLFTYLIIAVGFFVFGVLFGRKNPKKVETAVSTAEKVLPK